MSTPPDPGKALSVKVDQILYDDLATMMATGMTLSDAVRTAVSIVAGGYRNAWESGRIPRHVMPKVTHLMVRRYDVARGRHTAGAKAPRTGTAGSQGPPPVTLAGGGSPASSTPGARNIESGPSPAPEEDRC